MNLDSVRKIAERGPLRGLHPVPVPGLAQKNRSRWQFGVVMAPGYAAADPSETSFTRAECVLEHTGQARRPGPAAVPPGSSGAPATETALRPTAGTRRWSARSRSAADAAALFGDGVSTRSSPSRVARTARTMWSAAGSRGGTVSVRAAEVPGPWRALRLQVRAENRTDLGSVPRRRDDALPSALVAAHTIITVDGGTVPLDDRPAGVGAAGRGRMPQRGRLAGAGRRGGPRRAVLPDHPVRPPRTRRTRARASSTTAPRSTRS